MAENGLEHALKAIDPVARAMLDLSIRRRLPDSSIADLAQMPPDELVRWRGEVLDQLATQIGLTGPGAREEVRTRLESIEPAAWVGSAAAKSPPKATPTREPKPKPERQRPSRRLLVLLGLLVVVVIIVAILSLSGDEESNGGPTPPSTTSTATSTTTTKPTSTTSTTTTSTTTTPASPPVTMDPLPGMPDRGTATVSVDGQTITVELKGMPEPGGGGGVYELWLYNTLIGAQSLGTADSGNATITAELPDDAGDFRFLDLSRESADDDTIHSGISIRRAELAPLLN